MYVGGMCEVKPKSVKSAEMKRQQVYDWGHV
jgi:hypothetical protein